jgi:hypothetical protein
VGAGWCRRLVWCSPRRWCWWRRRFRLHPCLLLIDWGAESRSESWCVRWVHFVFSPWSAPVTPAERLPRGTCCLSLSLSPIAAFIVFASPVRFSGESNHFLPLAFQFHSHKHTHAPLSPSVSAFRPHNDNLLQCHML